MRELLYYPTFLPPSDEWIKKALLFWDGFSTIVPEENDDETKTESMNYLRGLNVYSPVNPNFYDVKAEAVAQMFEEELNTKLSDTGMRQRIDQCSPEDYFSISLGKMTRKTEDLLEHFGCLSVPRAYGRWLKVKRPAAEIYMTLLAQFLSQYATNRTLQPCTDILAAQKLAFEGEGIQGIKLSFLEAVPDVNPDVSFDEILKFREKRKDELRRFRKEIDLLQEKLNKAKNPGEENLIWTVFFESMEIALSDLKKASIDSGISNRFGSFETLLKAGSIPPAIAAFGAATVVPEPHTKLLALGLGGICSIYSIGLKIWQTENSKSKLPASYYLSCHNEGFFLSNPD